MRPVVSELGGGGDDIVVGIVLTKASQVGLGEIRGHLLNDFIYADYLRLSHYT